MKLFIAAALLISPVTSFARAQSQQNCEPATVASLVCTTSGGPVSFQFNDTRHLNTCASRTRVEQSVRFEGRSLPTSAIEIFNESAPLGETALKINWLRGSVQRTLTLVMTGPERCPNADEYCGNVGTLTYQTNVAGSASIETKVTCVGN